MRMQMIFRDAVANRRDASKAFWDTQNVGQDDPAQVMLGLGLIEASHGEVEGERMSDVLMGAHAGGLFLRFAGSAYDPGFHRAVENDLPGLGTEIRTRPPEGWSPELAFGSFFMRETRFPAAAGRVVHAALGLVVVRRNSLAERVMFDLEGRDGLLAQTSTSPEPDAFELGSAIGQTFGAPIWGWNGPKRAILSTLTLETIDGMARIRTLEGLPALTREQETELALLNRGPAGDILRCGRSDSQFRRFQEFARGMGLYEQLALAPDNYPVAETLARRDEAVASVMRSFLDREDEPAYAPCMG